MFDSTTATLAQARPCAAVLAELEVLDPEALSRDERVDLLVAYERMAAFVTARKQEVLAALEPLRHDCEPEFDFVPEQVGAALRLAPRTARTRIHDARVLTQRLPAVHAALLAGDISPGQARAFLELTDGLDDDLAHAIADRVLVRAATQSISQTRTALRRARIAADPADAAQRHARAVQDRRVELTPAEDGMATLWALLPAQDADAVLRAVRGIADRDRVPGDRRTIDQRHADALATIGYAYLDSGMLPTTHGHAPHLQVTVPAGTLAGDSDLSGDLAGHGPITGAQILDLLRRYGYGRRPVGPDESRPDYRGPDYRGPDERGPDYRGPDESKPDYQGPDERGPGGHGRSARVTVLPVDDLGRCVAPAPPPTSAYRPTPALRDHVTARDRICTFPYCTRAAERCDLDHARPHGDGGPTSAANLHPLCRRHHRAKHEGGWQVTRLPDGAHRWTGPTGRHYVTRPPEYPIPRPPPTAHADPP